MISSVTPLSRPTSKAGRQRLSSPYPFERFLRHKELHYQPRALRTILIDGLPLSLSLEDIIGSFYPHIIVEAQARQADYRKPVQSVQIEFQEHSAAKEAIEFPPFRSPDSDISYHRIIFNPLNPYFGLLWDKTDSGLSSDDRIKSTDSADSRRPPSLLWAWQNKEIDQDDLMQYAESVGYLS